MPIEWLASLTGLQSPPATDLALETCWLLLTRQVSVEGGVYSVCRSITTGKNRAVQYRYYPNVCRKCIVPCGSTWADGRAFHACNTRNICRWVIGSRRG